MKYYGEAGHVANLIEIQKADAAKKEDYKKIFANSALANHYFKKGNYLDDWLEDGLKSGNAYVAVDRSGEAVGYMSMKTADPMVDNLPSLTLLGVKENCRGRGIGHMLVEFYTEVMTQLGFEKAVIVVNDWNPRARKLYDSFGYKLAKTVEDPYIGGWDAHILVKKLG